tara:strand:- start:42 stop:236 length:195 start_codon:yes stop_codon:yes gene_type:complete
MIKKLTIEKTESPRLKIRMLKREPNGNRDFQIWQKITLYKTAQEAAPAKKGKNQRNETRKFIEK